MKKIDCLGDICPIPIMKLNRELKNLKAGESFMIVTDHSCTLKSVINFCKNHHLHYFSDEVINGVWEISIANKPFQ